jgi:hypothetical protein
MSNTRPTPPAAASADTGLSRSTSQRPPAAGHVADGDITRFEGTIVKVDADGNDVLSDHLMPGETLRREHTDRYTAVRVTPPDAAKPDPKTGDK